ncbi:hypothetical protein N7468_003837 [Penicillium chermesinum]|uniref:Uncharacterized protein n=1 Tax=Penicillium chermesinum TaxID=63820 RepID=A0A9W9P9S0_9EURO|nr:uncharacterized protein N7468_003837 [Penicillium chermesinum]KAJ5239218.1 hypothetical protein N7468_003837 [Penicillium chermesinum]
MAWTRCRTLVTRVMTAVMKWRLTGNPLDGEPNTTLGQHLHRRTTSTTVLGVAKAAILYAAIPVPIRSTGNALVWWATCQISGIARIATKDQHTPSPQPMPFGDAKNSVRPRPRDS